MDFCDDEIWASVVKGSQDRIINFDFLRDFADDCWSRFDEPSNEITYKRVPRDLVSAPYAEKILSIRSGYDLPISIRTGSNTSTRYVALVFQDPLRGKSAPDT